jgi:hypothetical protein
LFIGNNFTARNNLPALMERVAVAGGKQLNNELISVGGASLRTHWDKGGPAREIRRAVKILSFFKNKARCRSKIRRACTRTSACSTNASDRRDPPGSSA